MNILFIQQSVRQRRAMPLGLAYLAAVLENRGYQVDVIDLAFERLSERELGKRIIEINPDLIGLSALTPTYHEAIKVLRIVKEVVPKAKTVLGGPHPTILPEESIRESVVDFLVRGEGERTIVELVEALECEGDLSGIEGLSFKMGDTTIHNLLRPLIDDLDTIPFPAWHLFHINRYSTKAEGYRWANMMTGRGCPYDCVFCYRGPAAGKVFRARSPENVVEEIKILKDRFNIRSIKFWDDTFIIDRERVSTICDLFLKNNLHIYWTCQTRADCVDFELLKKMKAAGCAMILFGVESGSQKILNRIGKRLTKEEIRESFRLVKKAGLLTASSFMIGFPWDTKETIHETIRFAKELDTDYSKFHPTTPFPGTKLWEMYDREGAKLSNQWSEYSYFDYNDISFNKLKPFFGGEDLTREEIKYLIKKAHYEMLLHKLKSFRGIIRFISLRWRWNTLDSFIKKLLIRGFYFTSYLVRRRVK
jgi:anaerobic magnesium-protoporphyrin IX monomethyl ester cyclase